MSKRVVIYIAIIATVTLVSFQLFTMYGMLFNAEHVFNENETGIVIRQGQQDDNRIVFTCNVDWGEDVLPDMLRIFEENNLKITFFVSGRWAENNPKLLRKMYVLGHEIQNHGYGHRLCSKISNQQILEEINKTEDAILRFTGIKTDIFAPPAGDYDDRTIEICKEKEYILSLWSIDTIDWRPGSTAAIIEKRVLDKELKGGIVLMHPKEETVKALPT
ncbi:MAG TPA: polysaccharide deacetylase family protein, partial [Anaerovoracaceae bacterium]|nr:polysaccharide deacetylase family protein [Anaerovoracaceae bacterium]